MSTNAGMNWTLSETPAGGLSSVAVSGYGSKVVIVGGAVQICALQPSSPAPPLGPPLLALSVGFSGANPVLSWLVPSSTFVLQENSNLGSTNWADVSDTPTINFRTLHNEVRLSPSSSTGTSFFRLKQQ
jgi:hypothetical protein